MSSNRHGKDLLKTELYTYRKKTTLQKRNSIYSGGKLEIGGRGIGEERDFRVRIGREENTVPDEETYESRRGTWGECLEPLKNY